MIHLSLAVAAMTGINVSDAGASSDEALRAELLADAATRTSLLGEPGGQSGRDSRGFVLTDGGDYTLVVGGNAQFRYIANWRGDTQSPDSGYTGGFTFRRVRLGVSGTVISSRLSYAVQMDFLTGTDAKLYEAYGEYKLTDSSSLRWGQFKLPFWQEETNSFLKLQAVERSTVNSVFTQNYSQGVHYKWSSESLRLHAAFSDGLNTINTPYTAAGTEADYAFTGRGEWRWAGDWKQLDQFTSWRSAKYAGFLGAAAHFQDGGQTAAPGSSQGVTYDASVLSYTADLSLKGSGWNIYVAGIGRNTTDDVVGETFDDFGLLTSAGLFVTDEVELFARYSGVWADDDRAKSDVWNEYTIGFNNYFVPESHAAKLSVDFTYMPDDQVGSSALINPSPNGTGLLGSAGEQFMIRVQMQIVF